MYAEGRSIINYCTYINKKYIYICMLRVDLLLITVRILTRNIFIYVC